jgi:hypothetical protein
MITAIGFVEKELGEDSAEVKVLAYKESLKWVVDEDAIKKKFMPKGYVFGISFFSHNSLIKLNDFIRFIGDENLKKDLKDNDDEIIIKEVKIKLDYEIIEFDGFLNDFKSINMQLLQDNVDLLPHKFYIKNKDGYYGSFKIENGKVMPRVGQSVGFRKEILYEISYNNKTHVYEKLPKAEKQIDASYLDQKFKWFKNIIKSKTSPFYQTILKNTNWKEDFNLISEDFGDVEKSKIRCFIDNINSVDLTLNEVEEICNSSTTLKETLISHIRKYKSEIIQNNKEEINSEIQEFKIKIDSILMKHDENEKLLEVQEKNIEEKKIELEHISNNKERLLKDFNFFQSLSQNSKTHFQKARPLTYISNIYTANSTELTEISFRENCLINLHKIGINYNKPKKIGKIMEMISSYNCCLVNSIDINVILAIIKATNNYHYLISYVEPKWLTFIDLYESGLSEIWQSAHNNPECLHFYILRGVNISSPECYAAPLIDINNSIIRKLPIANNSWPINLRVIGSVVPDDIGLKITDYSFSNWGGIKTLDFSNGGDITKNEYIDRKLSIKSFFDMENKEDLNNNIEDFII